MHIVIEAPTIALHLTVKLVFSGMGERRVADVMHQRKRFGQIGVQFEDGRQGAGDLGYFKGMGKAVAEMIGQARGEDLGFIFKPAKGARMKNTVAVTLKRVAIDVGGFGEAATEGGLHGKPKPCEAKRVDSHGVLESDLFTKLGGCA